MQNVACAGHERSSFAAAKATWAWQNQHLHKLWVGVLLQLPVLGSACRRLLILTLPRPAHNVIPPDVHLQQQSVSYQASCIVFPKTCCLSSADLLPQMWTLCSCNGNATHQKKLPHIDCLQILLSPGLHWQAHPVQDHQLPRKHWSGQSLRWAHKLAAFSQEQWTTHTPSFAFV